MRRTFALLAILATLGPVTTARAIPSNDLVRTKSRFHCFEPGGARVTLWVRNVADHPVTVDPDIHFLLTLIRGQEHEPGPIVFMTPVPDFASLEPHEVSRFVIPMGDAAGDEPGSDFSADRLRLRVEVYLAGHEHPAVSRFRFPGCPPPIAPTGT